MTGPSLEPVAPAGHDGGLRQPPLVAHRGYALRYPENTLIALRAAVEAGACWLEFDVQLTRDRVPVLLHDESLERTGGRRDSILRLDAAEAVRAEVNEPARFGDTFSGVTIPRLTDVVKALSGWPGVAAFVELKRHSLAEFGVEATVALVLEDLAPVLERCVVISFDARAVSAARRLAGCPVGWALRTYDEDRRGTAARLGPDYLFCKHQRLPPEPATLWRGPWRWVVYEVTDAALARRLMRRGVALIETMAVAEMRAALKDAKHRPGHD